MEPRAIVCPCGNTAVVKQNTMSVGHITQITGFRAVFGYRGDILYLCPACYKRAEDLARQLAEVVGTYDVYFHTFEPKKKELG